MPAETASWREFLDRRTLTVVSADSCEVIVEDTETRARFAIGAAGDGDRVWLEFAAVPAEPRNREAQ